MYNDTPTDEAPMNAFLNTIQLPKVSEEQLAILNASFSEADSTDAIKSLANNKAPRPDRFSAEFYKSFKDEFSP